MSFRLDSKKINQIAFYILMAIAATVLQTVFAPALGFGAGAPSFGLVTVVCVGMYAGYDIGAYYGAALGFIIDVTAGRYVGANAIYFMIVGLVVGLLTNKVVWRNLFSAFMLFAGASALKAFYLVMWYGLISFRPEILLPELRVWVLRMLATAVYLPLFYLAVRFFCRRVDDLE